MKKSKNLGGLQGRLSRDEMKQVLGGSTPPICHNYACGLDGSQGRCPCTCSGSDLEGETIYLCGGAGGIA